MSNTLTPNDPLLKQVGGSHYCAMVIQPVEFCQKNGLGFCESSAIKYLCRHKRKNGVQDLEKAIHFIQILIKLEYPEGEKATLCKECNGDKVVSEKKGDRYIYVPCPICAKAYEDSSSKL